MSAEAAAICRDAAEIIQARGKASGAYADDQGRVCMWGALNVAAAAQKAGYRGDDLVAADSGLGENFPGLREFFSHRFTDSSLVPGAYEFNDRPETTERDVAKLLLQVADELEFA